MKIDKASLLKELNLKLNVTFPGNIKDVILFGSQITGKSSGKSDYDILIILKQKIDWKEERKISDICYEVDLKYGILTDAHIISEPDLSTLRGKQPIFREAIAKGLHV